MSESGDGPSPATPPGDNPTENPSEPTGPEPTAGQAAPAPEEAEEPFQPYLMAPPPAVEPPAPPAPAAPRPTPLDVAVELLPPRVTPRPAADSQTAPEPATPPVPGRTPAEVPPPAAAVEPPPPASVAPPVPEADAPPVPGEAPPQVPEAEGPPTATPPAAAPDEAPAAAHGEGEWTTVMVRRSAAPTTATTIEAPTPPRKGGIGTLLKPAGGPQVLVLRIGILLLGLIILTTVFVGGTTLVSRLRRTTALPTSSPTPSPTGQGFFPYSDPVHQFSIQRPGGWNGRQLATPLPSVVLLIGPDPPYPVNDFAYISQYPLNATIGPKDLFPLQAVIESRYLDKNVNIVSKGPSPVINGLDGWYYVWSTPPTTADAGSLNAGYFLIDGDRLDIIQLLVVPVTDNKTFVQLLPTFQAMAQTFQSFHQSGAATPTGTVTPRASTSP